MATNKSLARLLVLFTGFYLIVEGLGSFFLLEGDPMFQIGRLIRVALGFTFLVFILPKVSK